MKDSSATDIVMGQRAREFRKKRGMTLQNVADATGISVSTLSKIERGELTPAYDKLSRIADTLRVDVSAFHDDSDTRFEEGNFLIARAGEHAQFENDTYNYEIMFADQRGKAMLPATCTLKPLEQMRYDDYVRHSGQEFVFVLSGKVTVHLEGKPPVLLNTGDSVYFDSSRGHLYSSTTAEGARVLFLQTSWPKSMPQEKITKLPSPSAPETG